MMKLKIAALTLSLTASAKPASKTDDALAAALAQNKAQALQIQALTRAVVKTNADANNRATDATQQRDAGTVATVNAVVQAANSQIENAARVENKTDAAVATAQAAKSSADEAAHFGQSNNSILYVSLTVNLFLFLTNVFQGILKFISDGRTHAWQEAASNTSRTQTAQLEALKNNTDGLVDKIETRAVDRGHAQGIVDAHNDAGKTGD